MTFSLKDVELPEDIHVALGHSLESTEAAVEEPTLSTDEPHTEVPVAPLAPFREEAFFDGYSRTPTYIDQYDRLPQTVKEGAMQAVVYDLLDPADLTSYNKLLSEATCVHSPRAVMNKVETQTTKSGGWKVLAHYKPLWYKILNK